MKQNLMTKLGPGLLFAGAAIGVSHLVQSTRAGADYGWGLLWALLLINVIKYPFFQYGPRYALATNENLLEGYCKLGKGYLWGYFILNLATMFTVQTAVTIVTAGIASEMFGSGPSLTLWSTLLLVLCTLVLLLGRFRLLDKLMKGIVIVLSICSIAALSIALQGNSTPLSFTQAMPSEMGLIFLAAFMGWMPAPLDISVWHSIWTLEKRKNNPEAISINDGLFDFNVGYGATIFLGICFMGLGATVMFGSGTSFSSSGGVFAQQLIQLYTETLGPAFYGLIGLAALTTMFSTTLTTLDASPRVMSDIGKLLWNQKQNSYLPWLFILGGGTLCIFFFFLTEMGTLVQIATVLSFLTAPLFAFLNFKLVTSSYMPKASQPSKILRWWSRTGIAFLLLFALGYLYMMT